MMNGGCIEPEQSWNVISNSGAAKSIKLVFGELCELQRSCDVVVCSAFKNDYLPTRRSLIGALLRNSDINVAELARDPELNMRAMGCWLSKDTGKPYRRIACVELLDYYTVASGQYSDEAIDIIIRKSFSTLKFLLEQAYISGISVETIAMRVLGTGAQSIDYSYMITTMIAQCDSILKNNDGVREIVIYESSEERAGLLSNALKTYYSRVAGIPQTFLSYSSAQSDIATKIHYKLEKNDIPCWMAPGSIPSGSSYQEMIPTALNQVKAVVLLLTPEAENSRWVRKEVGTAIGSGKILIPYQINRYTIGETFRFLLDGEQILSDYSAVKEDHKKLVIRVKEVLAQQGAR